MLCLSVALMPGLQVLAAKAKASKAMGDMGL